jgi:hypothetical protein
MSYTATQLTLAVNNLPPPPGVPQSDNGVDPLVVSLIVLIVLGGVVIIAWLMKPIAARRLTDDGTNESSPLPVTGYDAWPQEHEGAGAGPSTEDVESAIEPLADQIVAADGSEPDREREDDEVAPSEVGEIVPPGPVSAPHAVVVAESDNDDAIVGITLAVRELLDYANSGQLLRGFSLYSEPFFKRYRAEMGLSDEEFAAEFSAIPAPPPEARVELAAVTDVEFLPDGRVNALITFDNGGTEPRSERFTFVRGTGDRWLIDDIAATG